MNTDIRLMATFSTHPKRRKLQRRLGPEGVLALVDLWIWCGQNRPDGRLTDMDADDIAIAAQFDGDADEFIEVLQALRLAERGEDGVLAIHDWVDNNPWAAGAKARSEKARAAAKSRWEKRNRIAQESDEHPQAMPDDASGNATSMGNDATSINPDAPSNAPSPSPSPSPSPGSSSSSEYSPRVEAPSLGPYHVALAAAGYDVMQVKGNAKTIGMLRGWMEEGIGPDRIPELIEVLKSRESQDWKNHPTYLDGPMHDLVNGAIRKSNGKRPPWAKVPRSNTLMEDFAKTYGFGLAKPGENYDQQRERLHREVQRRAQREGIQL